MSSFNWTGVKKVLIANRGECSIRIARTCSRLGVAYVAVYEENDAQSLHVLKATESHVVPSYLDQDALCGAALEAGCDSIHPGYGFLSENAPFASKVISKGLVWLGPSPAVMESFSSKPTARRIAEETGELFQPAVSSSPNFLFSIQYNPAKP